MTPTSKDKTPPLYFYKDHGDPRNYGLGNQLLKELGFKPILYTAWEYYYKNNNPLEWPLGMVLYDIACRIDKSPFFEQVPLLRKDAAKDDFLKEPYREKELLYDALIAAYARENNLSMSSDKVRVWANKTINDLYIVAEEFFIEDLEQEFINKREGLEDENLLPTLE